MADSNPFGGGNPHSLYTPMSFDEQEVLSRLIESEDLFIRIVGWGDVHKMNMSFGDLRIRFDFRVFFDKPSVAVPVHFFDMELRTLSDRLLFSERKAVGINGLPVMVGAGIGLDFTWWIAIKQMSPAFVKDVKPGSVGLTTREGNWRLDDVRKKLLHKLRSGEDSVRAQDLRSAQEATKRAEEDVIKGTVRVLGSDE